jgi:hypothetical protein
LDAVSLPPRGNVALTLRQHLEGQVHPDNERRRSLGKLQGHAGSSRGDVEDHRRRRRYNAIDHCPAPSAVLAHGEDLGQTVVTLREIGEQLLCESVPIAGDVLGHYFSWSEKISL